MGGSHMLLKGFPCKVVEITTSKTGKHGHAKASITGVDIFTGKKYEDSTPTSHNVDVPNVTRKDYTLVSINEEDYVTYMNEDGDYIEDLKLPTDDDDMVNKLKNDLKAEKNLMVSIVAAMNQEKIVGYREDKN